MLFLILQTAKRSQRTSLPANRYSAFAGSRSANSAAQERCAGQPARFRKKCAFLILGVFSIIDNFKQLSNWFDLL